MKSPGLIYDPSDSAALDRFIHENDQAQDWTRDIVDFAKAWTAPDNEYFEQRTSGTTGIPKNIKLPRQWMRASAEKTSGYLDIPSGSRALLCISARYIGGKMMFVRAVECGWSLYAVQPSSLPLIPKDLRMDFSAMLAMQVEALLDADIALDRYGTIIIGGAPVSEQLANRIADTGHPIYSSYGMTETSSHVALRRIEKDKRVFECLPGVTIDTDGVGRLRLHIAHFDELELQTNDIVERLDDRRFIWLGRADDVVNSGGLKLHPAQLESHYSRFIEPPFFFAGLPHPELGSALALVIEGSEDMAKEVMSSVPWERYERPKFICSSTSFMHTAQGKLLRQDSLAAARILEYKD